MKLTTPRAGMLQLAKLVASDLVKGRMSTGLQTVGLALSDSPDAVQILLDLLTGEFHKKRPSESLINALVLMIGQALSEARMAAKPNSR